ncbi:MAG: SDR family oxidoreductase [Solirubrobacterales bacterium]
MRVLVTGATGLVGLETMERLRREPDVEVVGVSRRRSATNGSIVAWDMAREPAPDELRGPWDAIVHAAADTRWTMTPEEAQQANVTTVGELVPLASAETHVVHVSTAYATGLGGSVESEDLADYRNTYEWSKAHAERLARDSFERLTIVRPPLIIGRREDGRAARFTGMYTVLRGIAASMVPVIVGDADAYFDVIPVDDLAELLTASAGEPGSGAVLTLAAGEGAPRVEEAVEAMTLALNRWREDAGCEPFDMPRLISEDSWSRFFLPFARSELSPRQLRILDLLSNFQPYMQVTSPLEPTHRVADATACIAPAVGYWAESERRMASMPPRPWKASA